MPQLSITIGSRDIDIIEYLSSRMQVAECEVVEVNKAIGNVTITHVYVDPKIAKQLSNSILLTAQGRVVESIEVEKKFALRELDNGKAYACVVRSEFLDDAVDQERTSFKIREEDLEAIKDAALAAAERFLHSHIARIRTTQKRLVIDLLEEHPQLAISVDNVTEYVNDLSPSMSDEDIAKTLFTLLYRHEKKVRAQIAQMQNGSADPNDQNGYVDGAVAALMKKVSEDAKLRLAEYTIKRHQIIQIARSMLKYVDTEEGSYELERTVHDFICPMGKMLSSKNYADHNLWLIDDLLSYYQFFASDKAMSAIGVDGERKEPDLLFFNPFGFRREDTTDPVVVIEFKRPGDEIYDQQSHRPSARVYREAAEQDRQGRRGRSRERNHPQDALRMHRGLRPHRRRQGTAPARRGAEPYPRRPRLLRVFASPQRSHPRHQLQEALPRRPAPQPSLLQASRTTARGSQ